MKKLAIFVEGQTELLFIDRLVKELAHKSGLAIEHAESTGGATRARQTRILKRITPAAHHQYYVLIVNCSGDSRVKSDILERYHGLIASGFNLIIGLRDVFGQFTYADIPRLRQTLRYGLPRDAGKPPIEIILSVMEIEAWFLAEHTHFERMNRFLTLELIRRKLRFDPARDDLQQRWHPAVDLDRAYQLVGARYTKQRHNLERTLDALDLSFFLSTVTRRFPDAERLVHLLTTQFA